MALCNVLLYNTFYGGQCNFRNGLTKWSRIFWEPVSVMIEDYILTREHVPLIHDPFEPYCLGVVRQLVLWAQSTTYGYITAKFLRTVRSLILMCQHSRTVETAQSIGFKYSMLYSKWMNRVGKPMIRRPSLFVLNLQFWLYRVTASTSKTDGLDIRFQRSTRMVYTALVLYM